MRGRCAGVNGPGKPDIWKRERMLPFIRSVTALVCLLPLSLSAQQPVTIRVDLRAKLGAYQPVWAYFGYDEPNFTYTKNGRKLINELSELSYAPVQIRAHNLLTTGNGVPALKWGSTNAYTLDAFGKPIYDWTIVDRIFDTYLHAGAKPFVEIGFMPEALSTHPKPYQHNWPKGDLYTGWSYPPKDYRKWEELVYQWVRHCVSKYGAEQVASWHWEVWNEPDGAYWHGSAQEYDKLYDYTADAVKRALPRARVGGPATTGPAGAKAAEYLRQFLEHCATGKNYVNGQTGAPLDFITFHAKGRPEVVQGHVRMGVAKNLQDVEKGIEIISRFPKFHSLPVILSESDPEGCAACSARAHPQNAYRNRPLYAAYTALALKSILDFAARSHTDIAGMLTWAFEFENQPYFDGFRTLATNGVDKPVLNIFRMDGLMRGDRVRLDSSGAIDLASVVRAGVRENPDIDGLAAASDHRLDVLVWNYHDDDIAAPPAAVQLAIEGLPDTASRVLLRHYRIDRYHSNAYTAWKKMGSPQTPTSEQYAKLERAGQLQLFESPRWLSNGKGDVKLSFALPRQAVSLVEMIW